ncbi:hypothetical protein TNCV_3793871 [Trichonephila clavipes]|nr:hypothetical protein TNCV_3793871 [Trichonephila clavipes]
MDETKMFSNAKPFASNKLVLWVPARVSSSSFNHARFNETFPQAELGRLKQGTREAAHRAAETPEQPQAQRQRDADYLASQQSAETTEHSQARRLQHAT